MKTTQWKRKGAWESAVPPSHSTSLALALLLISAIPPCTGTYKPFICVDILFMPHNTVLTVIVLWLGVRARFGESVRNWRVCRNRVIRRLQNPLKTSKVTKSYSRLREGQETSVSLGKSIVFCCCCCCCFIVIPDGFCVAHFRSLYICTEIK